MKSLNIKLTRNELDAFEEELGFAFPADYRSFLLKMNGCIICGENEDEYKPVPIDELKENFHPDVLFGFTKDDEAWDISYWMDEYGDELMPHTLIIGDSIEHGFIILICDGEDKGVYYWDDTFEFENSNEDCNAYYVADTFSEFFAYLEK